MTLSRNDKQIGRQKMASAVELSTLDKLLLLVKVSRVPGWCFGPILYMIGVIHAHAIPKTLPDVLRAGLMLFALSFPLCISAFFLPL